MSHVDIDEFAKAINSVYDLLKVARDRAEKAERERDEARKQMSDAVHEIYRGHRVPSCKSCEGPLTCAKCTVKEYPSSRLNDHEARIKELDTLVQAMGERVNDHERRLRSLEGKRK